MIQLERANFRETVDVRGIVLVECWAPGCGVCARFDPVFEEVAERHPQHVFARMNVMTAERLGEFFEIDHTPCLMLYRDGLLLLKKPGNFSGEQVEDFIRQAESLDMDRVREDLRSTQESPEDTDERTADP